MSKESPGDGSGWLVNADRFLRANWFHLVAETGAGLLAVAKLAKGVWGWVFVGLGFLMAASGHVLGHIWESRERPRVASLQQETRDLQRTIDSVEDALEQTDQDLQQLLESEIRRLGDEIAGTGETERISIYRHSTGGDSFSLAGRYSRNPEYCKDGRDEYPLGNDIISNAWKNREASPNMLPDPARNWKKYLKMLEKQNMDESTVKSLTMRSRCLYAKAIGDGDRLRKRLAVVVFESTAEKGQDYFALCRNSLSVQEEDRLCDLLGCSREPGYQSGNMALRRGL